MGRKRSLNFIVKNEIYPFDVMFSFGESDINLKKRFKKFGVSEGSLFEHSLKLGQCTQFKNGQVLVRMPNIPKTPKDYNTLQHEIFHATTNIMNHIGSKLDEESEEPWAYFIGFLTQKVYEKL